MFQKSGDAYLEWIKLAEMAAKRHDYETAARFYRYVTVHFGLLNDLDNFKEFSIKTGECYFNAGKNLRDEDSIAALQFYIKASNCFKEGRDKQRANECDSMIESLYDSIRRDGTIDACRDPYELKKIGDYFANYNIGKAIECYETAAEKAFEAGKLNLSGSLYGILGECYVMLKRYEDAAENYAISARRYYECREFFESAWRYCLSGFYFILAGKMDKASSVASKAESICLEDRINVILNNLVLICKFLSEGSIDEAKRIWVRIRRKFKENYVKIIDSCFQSLDSSRVTI